MKLQRPTEYDPHYYLCFGNDAFIHIINDWEQLLGRWNWYTFHLIHIYLEKDEMCGGYEFEFVIFGLGFRLRINNPNSEGYKEMERRIKDYKKDSDNDSIDLNIAVESQ